MRTIKFRGKPVDDNADGFVYGSLLRGFFYKTKTREEIVYISSPDFYPEYDSFEDMEHLAVRVYPETVGQYTGLKDKHGKEIYEGDIVRYPNIQAFGDNWKVEFDKGSFTVKEKTARICIRELAFKQNLEVIGNIYEHSYLLEQPNAN